MSEAVQLERGRWRVADFHKMVETALLSEDDRVELIDGEIVRMAPIGRAHAWTVNQLAATLVLALRERAYVSIQNPLALTGQDELQPDLMLLRAPGAAYRDRLLQPADVLLLLEVADSISKRDVEVKRPLYARAAIPEVWIFDLSRGRLLVSLEPRADGSYGEPRELTRGDAASPAAFRDVQLELSELLR